MTAAEQIRGCSNQCDENIVLSTTRNTGNIVHNYEKNWECTHFEQMETRGSSNGISVQRREDANKRLSAIGNTVSMGGSKETASWNKVG